VPYPAAGGSSLPSGSNTVPALSTTGYSSVNDQFQGMDAPTTFRFADPLQTIHSTRERKHGPVASVSPDPSQGLTTGYSSVNNQFQGMDAPTTFRFADPLQTIHSTRDMGSHGVNSTNVLGADQGSEREHVPTNSLQTSEGVAQEFE
jgi:hypothetical protein